MDDMYEPTSDYDDQMEGVRLGLLEYDDTHCKHGTFTGSWAGPDYMCHWCEDDDGDRQYELEQLRRRRVEALRPQLDEVLRAIYAGSHATPPDLSQPLFQRYLKLTRWGVRSHLFWYPDELAGAPCPHIPCDDCGLVGTHNLDVEH